MLAAVEEAANRRSWGVQEELLATLIEVTDSLRIAFLQANTPKHTRVPKPIQIPRPGQQTGPRPVRPSELAQMMTGR